MPKPDRKLRRMTSRRLPARRLLSGNAAIPKPMSKPSPIKSYREAVNYIRHNDNTLRKARVT